jgi:hypothetical protein
VRLDGSLGKLLLRCWSNNGQMRCQIGWKEEFVSRRRSRQIRRLRGLLPGPCVFLAAFEIEELRSWLVFLSALHQLAAGFHSMDGRHNPSRSTHWHPADFTHQRMKWHRRAQMHLQLECIYAQPLIIASLAASRPCYRFYSTEQGRMSHDKQRRNCGGR